MDSTKALNTRLTYPVDLPDRARYNNYNTDIWLSSIFNSLPIMLNEPWTLNETLFSEQILQSFVFTINDNI
jgi:hypothetical protein